MKYKHILYLYKETDVVISNSLERKKKSKSLIETETDL